jgi:hypothetical protein
MPHVPGLREELEADVPGSKPYKSPNWIERIKAGSAQESGMLMLGVPCQHPIHGGLCNELCINALQLQVHFEQQHLPFTPLEAPPRW